MKFFMNYFLFSLFVLIVSSVTLDKKWSKWKKKHGKSYVDDHVEALRRQIWQKNNELIKKHNKEADSGLHNYRLTHNKFSDLSYEDLSNRRFTFAKPKNLKRVKRQGLPNGTLGKSWISDGFNAPVHNQGQCDTAYAFAAISAIEALYYQETKVVKKLSVQQYLDCGLNKSIVSICDPGDPGGVYDFVRDNFIQSESTYEYELSSGYKSTICRQNSSFAVANISDYKDWDFLDTNQLKNEIDKGPLVVGVYVNDNGFFFYNNGTYKPTSTCDLKKPNSTLPDVNHYLLAVGYGLKSTDQSVEYFILLNSWGSDWGSNGYVYFEPGKCNLGAYASRPEGLKNLYVPPIRKVHNSATKSIINVLNTILIIFIIIFNLTLF